MTRTAVTTSLLRSGASMTSLRADWAQRAQMNARLIRAGQTKTVSIIDMVADCGIDAPVLRALAQKQAGEAAMFEAIKAAQGATHRSADLGTGALA